MAEPAVRITEAASLEALPPDALSLFGQDAFSTLAWYRATIAAGLPEDSAPCFQLAVRQTEVLGVFPMRRSGRALGALATPYTCLWQPLLAPGLPAAILQAIGHALASSWRRAGVVRLDAMAGDNDAMAQILAGLRAAGLPVLPFAHFGNWHTDTAGLSWDEYLAARPGAMRSTIKRSCKRLMQTLGATFTLVQDNHGLEHAIAAYEAVYAASWKEPEPQPAFNATLMRACAAQGTSRLGIITLSGAPIAAQFWLVHKNWAGVLKLAHDESHRALAPGTVLTSLMIRHMLDVNGAQELDFGRGDDAYKRLWAGERRQRVGALVVNPLSGAGLMEIARQMLGKSSFLKRTTRLLSMRSASA